MSSKQGKINFSFHDLRFFFYVVLIRLREEGIKEHTCDLLIIFFEKTGGKAKPLKQPKADKKEYDEVNPLFTPF